MNDDSVRSVLYVHATPEVVWTGLTAPELTRRSWVHDNVSDRRTGSEQVHRRGDEPGTVGIVGTVLDREPEMCRRVDFGWPAVPSGLKSVREGSDIFDTGGPRRHRSTDGLRHASARQCDNAAIDVPSGR